MRIVTAARGSDARRDFCPWLVSGLGGLAFACLLTWLALFPGLTDPASVALALGTTGVPALVLVWGGYRLERSEISPSRYGRIVRWCFGGGAGFLLVNLPSMLVFPWYGLSGNIAWALFSITTGAVGGFAIGYVEARAIQREVEATAATVRARRLEDEREFLTYLNDLLRHEVLNTAQIVGGHATLLLDDCDDEQARERLETIERNSEDLVAVIDDVRVMLNANRDDSAATVELLAILEAEVAALRAAHDGVTVELQRPAAPADVPGNEGIRRIFSNLLENAVEHHDGESPRVDVTVETTPSTVTVAIADDGPGIPERTRAALFERKSNTHGLGLYLSRILANRYDGSVALEETGPDGSTFTVTLPRASSDSDGSSDPSTAAPSDADPSTDGSSTASTIDPDSGDESAEHRL